MKLVRNYVPVKQGFIRVLTEMHASKSRVSVITQHLQLFFGNHVEQLAAVLQHAAQKLPHKGPWLKGRVLAAELAVPPSRARSHPHNFGAHSQVRFQ